MKVTIQINGIDTDIELTPEQVANVEAQQKPKKFEWEYPKDRTYVLRQDGLTYCGNGDNPYFLEHGTYRKSIEVAERSLLRNKRANRLEALAEQLGGLKEFVIGEENYSLTYYTINNIWNYRSLNYSFFPCEVYMTKECVIEICRMLNEGEFSLDGEL